MISGFVRETVSLPLTSDPWAARPRRRGRVHIKVKCQHLHLSALCLHLWENCLDSQDWFHKP